MISDAEFEKQLKQDFLVEADEIIQNFENVLLKLESDADPSHHMNEMFRYAHSLKGSGLAAGFSSYGTFAHKLENLLDAIRAGKVAISKSNTDLMLAALDALRSYGKELESNFAATHDFIDLEKQLILATAPLSKPIPPPPIQVSKIRPTPQFEDTITPKVFVLEDDESTREMILEGFPEDWKIEGFESGETFIERFKKDQPHLIITDLKLPGMSGREVIEYVRASSPKTPVIFISGYAERADIVKFLALGAFAFFEKPFNMRDLTHSCVLALRDWMYFHTIEEVSILAFRTFMSFNAIVDLLPTAPLSEQDAQKIRVFEQDLTRIGALCTRAGKFATEA